MWILQVKTEEASLRDALLKMQSLNEGLGQDKIELNKIIMQMEHDRNVILGAKSAVEQEKLGLKDELIRVEQEKLDIDNDKVSLQHSRIFCDVTLLGQRHALAALDGGDEGAAGGRDHAAESRSRGNHRDAQRGMILAFPVQFHMKSLQTTRQKTALAEELVAARKEIERQSDTIVRVAKEKEELTKDKAALSVQVRTWRSCNVCNGIRR